MRIELKWDDEGRPLSIWPAPLQEEEIWTHKERRNQVFKPRPFFRNLNEVPEGAVTTGSLGTETFVLRCVILFNFPLKDIISLMCSRHRQLRQKRAEGQGHKTNDGKSVFPIPHIWFLFPWTWLMQMSHRVQSRAEDLEAGHPHQLLCSSCLCCCEGWFLQWCLIYQQQEENVFSWHPKKYTI